MHSERRGESRCAWRADGERGASTVEFATLGVLLLVPIVYLVVTVGRVQAASLAAQAGARSAARVMTSADTTEQGRARAAQAADLAVTDQGFDTEDGRLDLVCSERACLTPGARVTATVQVSVVLPGVPGFVDGLIPLRVQVRASQVAAVDTFRAPG